MSLGHAVLGLLNAQPGSGYDMLKRKRFENSMANVRPATQSQLHGELAKLEKAGLVGVTPKGAARPQGVRGY